MLILSEIGKKLKSFTIESLRSMHSDLVECRDYLEEFRAGKESKSSDNKYDNQ